MPMIYKSLTDMFNKATWDTIVPDSLEIAIPYYYQKYPERMPIHNPDETTRALGKYTISQIVGFCVDGVVFSMDKSEDLVSICKYITTYIEEMHMYVAQLPDTDNAVIFFNKCKRSLAVLDDMNSHLTMLEEKAHIKPPASFADMLKLI